MEKRSRLSYTGTIKILKQIYTLSRAPPLCLCLSFASACMALGQKGEYGTRPKGSCKQGGAR